MTRFLVITLFLITVGCSTNTRQRVSSVEQLPYYSEATFTPEWFDTEDGVPDDYHQISSFSLVNQSGETLTEKDVEGKIYVSDFFFTSCPGICPKMTTNMQLVQEAFINDEDVLILSHSVTPEYDSVYVLKTYAELNGVVDEKWHLLTGDRNEIYDLGRNQYFVEEDLGLDKDPDDFIHTENFVLIDKERRIRGIYNGLNKAAVNQLIEDIKTLQNE